MEQHNLNDIVYILDYYSNFTNPPFEIDMGIENELDNSVYQYEGVKYKICEIKTYSNNRLNKELRKKIGLDNSNNEIKNQTILLIGYDFTTIKNYYIKYAELNNSIINEILNPKILNLKKQYAILSNRIYNENSPNINLFLKSDIYQYFFLINVSIIDLVNSFNLKNIEVEEINEVRPFKENKDLLLFKKWIEKHKDNKGFSYFYHRIKRKLINCTQIKYIDYLFKNGFINEKDYNYYSDNHITSLKNCTSQSREDYFELLTENN